MTIKKQWSMTSMTIKKYDVDCFPQISAIDSSLSLCVYVSACMYLFTIAMVCVCVHPCVCVTTVNLFLLSSQISYHYVYM